MPPRRPVNSEGTIVLASRPMNARRRVFALGALLAISIGCEKGQGGSGQTSEPIILPPTLERVIIAPSSIDQQVVARVVVRNPSAVPLIQIDNYLQNPGMADILFIVDNTGSMALERLELGANFQRFIDELIATQTNFQVAVTSNSMAGPTNPLFNDPNATGYQGTLRSVTVGGISSSIITNATVNPSQVFVAATTFPDTRLRWDRTFSVMVSALTPPLTSVGQPNYGFLRAGAALAVIVVTNGDDQSFGTVAHYARFLRSIKGVGNENIASFSSIVGDVPNGCTPANQQNYYGSQAEAAFRYTDMSLRTGGVVGSICNPTFEQILIQVADALKTLRRIFSLSLNPVATSISVRVNGAAIAQDPVNGWTYQSSINSIVFAGNYLPPPGAKIEIQYVVA